MAKRSRLKYFNDFHIIFLDMRPNSHTRLSTHWILYGPILENKQRRSVINISVFFKLLAFPKHDLDVMLHKKGIHVHVIVLSHELETLSTTQMKMGTFSQAWLCPRFSCFYVKIMIRNPATLIFQC